MIENRRIRKIITKVLPPTRLNRKKFVNALATLRFGKKRLLFIIYFRIFLSHKYNAKLQHGEHVYIISYKEEVPLGCMLVGINKQLNDQKGYKQGYFSLFDCVNTNEIAEEVFNHARGWLNKQGINKLVGPENYTYNDFGKGLLVKGNNLAAYVFNPHNPKYYEDLFKHIGLEKMRDHYAYDFTIPYYNIKQIETIANWIYRNTKIRVMSMKLNNKTFNKEATALYEILSHRIPEELDQLANPSQHDIISELKNLKTITYPYYIKVAYKNEQPLGIMISVPNYNEVFAKTDLCLFRTLYSLLFLKRKIKSSRILFLYIIPEYQKQGIAASLFYATYAELVKNGVEKVELSTIDEENVNCRSIPEKFTLPLSKIYREYSIKI